MAGHHPASSTSEPASRRRLLRLIGAGSAALVASLLPRNGTQAGHDGTNVFHLGQDNAAGAKTSLAANVQPNALMVLNETGSGIHAHAPSGIGLLGSSDTYRGVYGHSESDTGVQGDSVHGAGVFGASENGPGVQGASFSGTSTGVQGSSDSGAGVEGHSQSGPGVVGHSSSGEGGHFATDSGVALSADGPTHFGGNAEGFLVGIDNANSGEIGGGILANSRGGKPTIEADVFPSEFNPGVGLQGVSYTGTSYDDGEFAQGPGVGVQGLSGTGTGVEGHSSLGTGVRGEGGEGGVDGRSQGGVGISGTSETGISVLGLNQGPDLIGHVGVLGLGSTGIFGFRPATGSGAGASGAAPGNAPGVLAISGTPIPPDPLPEGFWFPQGPAQIEPDDGLALDVIGKARFTTAGNDAVAEGDTARFVAQPAVSAVSHISVTLHGDPGSRQVRWVERHPGSGFTAHFAGGPPPQRPTVPFSYLIVEPAGT